MHHVAEKFSRGVTNLVVKAVCAFLIDTKHALVPLKEGKGTVMLKVEIQGSNDLLFKVNELISSHLLSEQCRQPFNHHFEAWVHMLVHFSGQKNADCS